MGCAAALRAESSVLQVVRSMLGRCVVALGCVFDLLILVAESCLVCAGGPESECCCGDLVGDSPYSPVWFVEEGWP